MRSTGRTVYVVVSTDGSGKRPVPPKLRAGLESTLIAGPLMAPGCRTRPAG